MVRAVFLLRLLGIVKGGKNRIRQVLSLLIVSFVRLSAGADIVHVDKRRFAVFGDEDRHVVRVCLSFAQPYFEDCFRGYFLVVVSISLLS